MARAIVRACQLGRKEKTLAGARRTLLGYDYKSLGFTAPREALIAISDPIDIPEIKEIIGRVTEEPASKGTKTQLGSGNSGILGSDRGFLSLPLDIQLLLLDCLHPADARRILAVTGWQAPDSYWQRRSPRGLIFEIDRLDPSAKVDWALFCQEGEELLESHYGLQNRARLFRILKGTGDLFFSALGDRELKN